MTIFTSVKDNKSQNLKIMQEKINVTNWQKALVLAFRTLNTNKIEHRTEVLKRRIEQAKAKGIQRVEW